LIASKNLSKEAQVRLIVFSIEAFLILFAASAHTQGNNPDPLTQAKQEGSVAWYTTISIPESQKLAALFQKQYPFLRVEIIRSGSGALVNRVISEYNANKYLADVLTGTSSRGGYVALKERGILGVYHSPEFKYLPSDLKDPAGYWGSQFQNTFVLAYNTNMVKPPDVPKTYDDLLKPMWTGKKILNDTENYEWFDGLLHYWGKEKGLAYFRKLAQQEQVFQRGARGRVQLVAAGEFPLTIGYGPHVQSFIKKGAPVDWVPLEPVVVITSTVSIAQKAQHPAASRLFIDFLLSKPAQLMLRDFNRIPSREDVDPDPPRLFKGFKKVVQDLENDTMDESTELYQKIFGLGPG
jgi:iron(III) transport system substrate-binding protein